MPRAPRKDKPQPRQPLLSPVHVVFEMKSIMLKVSANETHQIHHLVANAAAAPVKRTLQFRTAPKRHAYSNLTSKWLTPTSQHITLRRKRNERRFSKRSYVRKELVAPPFVTLTSTPISLSSKVKREHMPTCMLKIAQPILNTRNDMCDGVYGKTRSY